MSHLQVEQLVRSPRCPGTSEPVLAAALEMLAPGNCGSDLLVRLPGLEEQWLAREATHKVEEQEVSHPPPPLWNVLGDCQ